MLIPGEKVFADASKAAIEYLLDVNPDWFRRNRSTVMDHLLDEFKKSCPQAQPYAFEAYR